MKTTIDIINETVNLFLKETTNKNELEMISQLRRYVMDMKDHGMDITFIRKLEDLINSSYPETLAPIDPEIPKQINQEFEKLQRDHPRSGYVSVFKEKLDDLISGKITSFYRNEFNLSQGATWGIEFLDLLVDKNLLSRTKEGNKVKLELYNPEIDNAAPINRTKLQKGTYKIDPETRKVKKKDQFHYYR